MRSWTTFKTANSNSNNSWDNLQNKPAILSDNQINWNEIEDKPIKQTFLPRITTFDNTGVFSHTIRQGEYIIINNILIFSIKLKILIQYANFTTWLVVKDIPFTFPATEQLLNGLWGGTPKVSGVTPFAVGAGNIITPRYQISTSYPSYAAITSQSFNNGNYFDLWCTGSVLL
jgi:hypothetical protein